MIFSLFDLSRKKSARAYSCLVFLANRKADSGMHVAFAFFSKQIGIQTDAIFACTFLIKSIYEKRIFSSFNLSENEKSICVPTLFSLHGIRNSRILPFSFSTKKKENSNSSFLFSIFGQCTNSIVELSVPVQTAPSYE